MARGQKREIVYEGKALKLHEKVLKLENDLKAAKEERDSVYKEQLAAKKEKEKKARQAELAAAKKAEKEKAKKVMEAIKKSGKSSDEIISLLGLEIESDDKKTAE